MIDEPTARAIAIILTVLGVPALLASLLRSLWKWWTGRAGRERAYNIGLARRLEDAEIRAAQEAASKRKALEYASELRRQLAEAGKRPVPWPKGLGSPRDRRRSPDTKEMPIK